MIESGAVKEERPGEFRCILIRVSQDEITLKFDNLLFDLSSVVKIVQGSERGCMIG